jgi:transposase-like protein
MKDRRWIRERIVGEYLSGDSNYRELELLYGIGKSTLQRWVKAAGQNKVEKREDTPGRVEETRPVETAWETEETVELSESESAAEIKRLKRELHKAELHAEVLTAMMDIARDELGIDIRKKHGPRR